MAYRPDRPEAALNRRYVWAIVRGVAPPPDTTTRVRVFCNRQELTPRTRLDDPGYATSFSFFPGHHGGQGGAHDAHADADAGGGASLCVDLTPSIARLENPRQLRGDRLTVQLLPTCADKEAARSVVRTRCVEVVVL
jgi:hypothetical protein